jgi:hypothetical protein
LDSAGWRRQEEIAEVILLYHSAIAPHPCITAPWSRCTVSYSLALCCGASYVSWHLVGHRVEEVYTNFLSILSVKYLNVSATL